MQTIPFLILFAGGIILTVGDLVFKNWAEKGASYSFVYIFGILMYVVGSMALVESYKYDVNIALAGVVQVIFNTVILVAFTFFYFKEPISTKQAAGLILSVVSLYLIR